MAIHTGPSSSEKHGVVDSFEAAPIVGVVRTDSLADAEHQARAFIAAGLELVEVTFTVPDAPALITRLRKQRGGVGPPWIGAGTVSSLERAEAALEAGAEFVVTPNVNDAIARTVRSANVFLVMGALTTTEICAAHQLGADLIKVYPLPPVGGPTYLSTIRQPLGDIPMLAAGGFNADEIPAYRDAGAIAFGIAMQLLGDGDEKSQRQRVLAALALARGD